MINSFTKENKFLSNFYPCNIQYENITYPSVEHYYVAMKIDTDQIINGLFHTVIQYRLMISKVHTPNKVKQIGKNVIHRKDWNTYRLDVMNWAVREKFKNNELSKLLIYTGKEELIEGNWWQDIFWGVCNGKGKNHLGKILMKVRDELNGIKVTGLEYILR